jgi:hypothetical protein
MTIDELRNYSVDEAAEILGCKKSYLEDNAERLPRQKIGRALVFDVQDLMAIKEMHRLRPAEPQTSTAPVARSSSARPLTLADCTPVGGRGRRTG